ncbi:hypothetical protein ABK040_010737 [Willaertia magna]
MCIVSLYSSFLNNNTTNNTTTTTNTATNTATNTTLQKNTDNTTLQKNTRYPFILLNNRDEEFNRPTSNYFNFINKNIICIKDLVYGNTWMAINFKNGNFGVLTNIDDNPIVNENLNFNLSFVKFNEMIEKMLNDDDDSSEDDNGCDKNCNENGCDSGLVDKSLQKVDKVLQNGLKNGCDNGDSSLNDNSLQNNDKKNCEQFCKENCKENCEKFYDKMELQKEICKEKCDTFCNNSLQKSFNLEEHNCHNNCHKNCDNNNIPVDNTCHKNIHCKKIIRSQLLIDLISQNNLFTKNDFVNYLKKNEHLWLQTRGVIVFCGNLFHNYFCDNIPHDNTLQQNIPHDNIPVVDNTLQNNGDNTLQNEPFQIYFTNRKFNRNLQNEPLVQWPEKLQNHLEISILGNNESFCASNSFLNDKMWPKVNTLQKLTKLFVEKFILKNNCDDLCDKFCKDDNLCEKNCDHLCDKFCKEYFKNFCDDFDKNCDKNCDKEFEPDEIISIFSNLLNIQNINNYEKNVITIDDFLQNINLFTIPYMEQHFIPKECQQLILHYQQLKSLQNTTLQKVDNTLQKNSDNTLQNSIENDLKILERKIDLHLYDRNTLNDIFVNYKSKFMDWKTKSQSILLVDLKLNNIYFYFRNVNDFRNVEDLKNIMFQKYEITFPISH